MKPTNYHLFDFLDFDTELSRNESLWKAYKPTAVYEKEGDIYVTVPFQKQKLANDMMADTDVPQEEYTLIIRQYNIGITRLFLGFGDYVLTDESEMLQFMFQKSFMARSNFCPSFFSVNGSSACAAAAGCAAANQLMIH